MRTAILRTPTGPASMRWCVVQVFSVLAVRPASPIAMQDPRLPGEDRRRPSRQPTGCPKWRSVHPQAPVNAVPYRDHAGKRPTRPNLNLIIPLPNHGRPPQVDMQWHRFRTNRRATLSRLPSLIAGEHGFVAPSTGSIAPCVRRRKWMIYARIPIQRAWLAGPESATGASTLWPTARNQRQGATSVIEQR